MTQGSGKQCRLTPQGVQKLRAALINKFGASADYSEMARELFGNVNLRESITKVLDGRDWVVLSSIDRLFNPLELDLETEDYESKPKAIVNKTKPVAPNPFESVELWGWDERLRQVFE